MDKFTPEQKKYLYNKIKRDILGISSLGFFDKDSHWPPFMDKTYFRHGGLQHKDGWVEKYSVEVSKHLSGAATLHTIERIDTLLKELLEQE